MSKVKVKTDTKTVNGTPIFIIKYCQKISWVCLALLSLLVLFNLNNQFLIKVVGFISIIVILGAIGGSALVNLFFNWLNKN